MFIQADKGRTITILTQKGYTNKVHTFLADNNFLTVPKDPTKRNTIHSYTKHSKNSISLLTNKEVNASHDKKPTPTYTKSKNETTQTRQKQ
jgi:hypothetical protein